LDSVFQFKKPLYRIKEKSKTTLTKIQKDDLIRMFGAAKKHELDAIEMQSLNPFEENLTSRYGIFVLIHTKPRFNVSQTAIRLIRLEVIVLDFKSNSVVFYDRSHQLSPKDHGGYAQVVIKLLDDIYMDIRRL